ELGEIETLLLSHKNITDAIVVVKRDKENANYLAAYYVPKGLDSNSDEQQPPESTAHGDAVTPESKTLRDMLSEKVPDYMIPSYFVPLEKLPVTPNGKIDRKALPEPGKNALASKDYQAPTNTIEKKLVDIWQDVLGADKIGINDNFFEIGGHSLKAISIIAKINKHFRVELPLTKLFENKTIKNLTRYISQSATLIFTAIQAVEKKEYYPVSAAQKRMVALNRFAPGSVTYNIPGG
ncbi:MAG: hypothetical protein GY757_56220, partial [bacterium]|nr:hypothetical protein [bacterium]